MTSSCEQKDSLVSGSEIFYNEKILTDRTIREAWTYPHLKVPVLEKTFNKRRQSASVEGTACQQDRHVV